MSKERRLGRGLEALLGQLPGWTSANPATPPVTAMPDEPSAAPVDTPRAETIASFPPVTPLAAESDHAWETAVHAEVPAVATPTRVATSLIDSNPFQPRQDFTPAEMQSLSESIAEHGILQPVVVRRNGDRYQLIAGERRLRAAVQAGWTEVPIHLVEADDRQTAEIAIVENLQRRDLNPLEKAASFQRYLAEYGCTQEDLAGRLKIDRSTIANLIRLLELPDAVQEAVRRGRITQGHARALLPLGDEREQVEFCQRIQRDGMNVRQTETAVQQMIATTENKPLGVIGIDGHQTRPVRPPSEHLAALEQQIRAALGTKVAITHNAKGCGKMVIHFASHEEFERLREHICGVHRPVAQAHAG